LTQPGQYQDQFIPVRLERGARLLLYLLFFASGAAALIYQVTWMRIISRLLGSTTLAGSLILAAIFAGFALGAWIFGRVVDRGGSALTVYGLVEVCLGFYAVTTPAIFHGVDYLLGHFDSLSALNFIILWIVLLLPSALMGGTLPLLSKFAVRRLSRSGGTVGRLYAINAFGSSLAAVAAAFVLIRTWGIVNTIIAASLTNVSIGLVVLWLIKRGFFDTVDDTTPIERESSESPYGRARRRETAPEELAAAPVRLLMVAAVFITGLVAIGGEVLWLRLFSISFDSSVQSFGLVVSLVIAGTALGSAIFARFSDVRARPLLWAGLCLTGAALALALIVPFLDRVSLFYFNLIRSGGGSWSSTILLRIGIAALLLLPSTILIAGLFPLAVRLVAGELSRIGSAVGALYTSSTLGGVAGSLLAGLVLIPALGTRLSFLLFAFILGILGMVVLFSATRDAALRFIPLTAFIVLLLIPLALGPWNPGRMIVWWGGAVSEDGVLLYHKEGREANVAVVQREDSRALFVGKKLVASDHPDAQRHLGLLAHIPLLLHPQPQHVLVIGLATGITLNAVLSHPVEFADCVEINPAMSEAAGYFEGANGGVLQNPRARFHFDDARHFIAGVKERYECITTDPIHPADANSNNLYSLEFFRTAAQALKADGVMCQWLPAADLAPAEVRRVIRTFTTAFKYVSLWAPNLGDLALIGSNERLKIDLDRLERRIREPDVSVSLSRFLGDSRPEQLLALYTMDNWALRKMTEGVQLNTDDRPILEYEAPKDLWNPANLPLFFFEVTEQWHNAFDELWKQVEAAGAAGRRERYQRAHTAMRNRLRLDIAQAFHPWCRELESRGRLETALVQYERMFSLFPKTLNPLLLDACIGMSLIYEQTGKRDKAEEFYNAAITMSPSRAENHLIAGEAFAERGRLSRAAQEWRRVLELDPNNLRAREYLREIGAR